MSDNFVIQPYVVDLVTKEVLDYGVYNKKTEQYCGIRSSNKDNEYLQWYCKEINKELI